MCHGLGQVWSCSAQRLRCCRYFATGYQPAAAAAAEEHSANNTQRLVILYPTSILLQHPHVMLLGCSYISILKYTPSCPHARKQTPFSPITT